MAQNTTTVTDPLGQFEDWIELYNTTSSPLLLDGLFLSDTATNLQKWQFPNGISIPPGGYLIVWADEDLTEVGIHADFKLSASGESVIFSKADGTIVDTVTFGPQTSNISYARIPNGTGNFVQQTATFNGNNQNLSVEVIEEELDIKIAIYPNPASNMINIISPVILDKIEIYNMLGQVMQTNNVADNQFVLDVGHLPSGTYLVKFYSNEKEGGSKFVKM